MSQKRHLIQRELLIHEEMSLELPAYLASDVVIWTMERADMPRLTIGGYLMRRHRLAAVLAEVDPTEQAMFRLADKRMDKLFSSQPVRFEQRAHRELWARLGEWMGHLRHWSASAILRPADYAREVDTRVVITALTNYLRSPPFRLEPSFELQLEPVDRHLHGCWETGGFVWPEVWRPAYPAADCWWLYGQPHCQSERAGQFRLEIPLLTPIQ